MVDRTKEDSPHIHLATNALSSGCEYFFLEKLLNKFSLFIQGHLSNLKILYIWHFKYNTMVSRLLKKSRSGHICVQQRILIFNNCIFVELQGITLIQLQRRNYIHSTSRKI